MIVNPEKFQAIVVKKNAKIKDSYTLNINDLTINSENNVKLLGIEIENKLSFEQHISTLCNKEYKNSWVLGKNKFFLIVLYIQTLIIVLSFGIFAHLNLYIKSKK